MAASYLFDSDGLKSLARYVETDTLFVFDLDSILTPTVATKTAATIEKPVQKTLARINELGAVMVITGRSKKDALDILGFEPKLLIGKHNKMLTCHKDSRNWQQIKLCLKWQEQLYEILGFSSGIEIEFKGESLSLHYGNSENPENALVKINAAIEKLAPLPKKNCSELTVNLLPNVAIDKGGALEDAMRKLNLNRAIFVGDDVTNEGVLCLKEIDIFGIHFGKGEQTAAPYYLKKETALLGLLNSIAGMLETVHRPAELIENTLSNNA